MFRQGGAPNVAIGRVAPLGWGAKGLKGVVAAVGGRANDDAALGDDELERRLLEMGFVEGARVEILHEGAIGGDPIAIRLDDMRVALRRREAEIILVRIEHGKVKRSLEGRAA